MEGLPEITRTARVSLKIEVPEYMRDHHSMGTVILPAVEIMEILASSVIEPVPGIDVMSLADARFDRFIPIAPGQTGLECFSEIEIFGDGGARAKLLTKASLKGGITRTKEHASVVFGRPVQGDIYPSDMACCLEGVAFEVPVPDLYRDLVPFGPAYQNLTGTLYLTKEGAIGGVSGGNIHSDHWPLGSPFPLDGAFHAACAWGQRFTGTVVFPVGFALRKIHSPAQTGESLICRIVPVSEASDSLTFDLYIYRQDGVLCESVIGLVMKDVSGGKAVSPEWVRRGAGEKYFTTIEKVCPAFAVIDRKTVAPFAARSLSPAETERRSGMGERRSGGFIAARLCCKRMSRGLSGNDLSADPGDINTIDIEGIRPRCPSTDALRFFPCSVSHDSRFAFAAAGGGKIGVDVELLAERVVKVRHFYMSESETALSGSSELGDVSASLRIWSIKECVTKALDFKLYEAWRQSEVVRIGLSESIVRIGDNEYTAYHDPVDEHLFTVLILE